MTLYAITSFEVQLDPNSGIHFNEKVFTPLKIQF